jgi:hypothetical protein
MTRTIGLCTTLIALSGFAFACGSMGASSLAGDGTETQNPGTGDAAGGRDPAAAAPPTGPVDNAVILVHAAKAQAFRLCFENELDRRPQPDSQVMPEANVVGVEVGSTVRLGPLSGPPGEVFLFDEPSIRAFYPQFGGAGTGPTCGNLLSPSNPLSKSAVSLGKINTNLSTGVHLLVVRGCPANGLLPPFFSLGECGAGWTETQSNLSVTEIELRGAERPLPGTLPAQVVNLSQPLEGARAGRKVVISFGELTNPSATLVEVTSNPTLFGSAAPAEPAQLPYASDNAAIFGSTGFRVSLVPGAGAATVVLDQTLEHVQEQSSPRDVPPAYYSTASNYALLLLGDPDPKLKDGGADTDIRRGLHLIAVPVIQPRGDAGADDGGGGPLDGGAAPTP